MDDVNHEAQVKYAETDRASLTVAGDVDASNADRVRLAILDAAGQSSVKLNVDLSGVTFMDSSGLQAIADASRDLAAFGSGLVLCNVPRQVLRLLAITDIWTHLDVI